MPGELNPNFIYSHGNISFLLKQKKIYAGWAKPQFYIFPWKYFFFIKTKKKLCRVS
jgi:hypothetical protein